MVHAVHDRRVKRAAARATAAGTEEREDGRERLGAEKGGDVGGAAGEEACVENMEEEESGGIMEAEESGVDSLCLSLGDRPG
eukprot:1930405-Ditylum_brightwellii.AAC.1